MSAYSDFRPRLRFQQTVALSPSGNTVAYSDDASGNFNVTVQPIVGGPARSVTAYPDRTVRRVTWHPSGHSLVFSADSKGDENTQLFEVASDGARLRALTDAPHVQHAVALGDPFSPDGRLLAYTANDRNPGDRDVLVRDLETGDVRRVYRDGGRVLAGHWSPDGTQLTATEWIEGNTDHVVYLVPAAGGSAVRLTPEGVTATYWLGPWLPDGSGFLVRSNAGREFTGLAVLDAATGAMTWLETPEWDVEEVALSADGRILVWLVNVGGASTLCARDLHSGADLAVPTLPRGIAGQPAVSADGTTAAMLLSTPTCPWNVAVADLQAGQLRLLTDAAPIADSASMVEPTLVHYQTGDGREVPAYLYRPTDTPEPVGVVISVHGGPVAQERAEYRYDGFYQYLVSHGIAVLTPNGRGSDGYGKSNIQAIYRDWGGGDLTDLTAAVHYLRTLEWVAPERIGLYGFSYGGFVVLSGLARLADLGWAAAVVHSGPSNLVTLATASPPALRTLVTRVIGDPEADRARLLARSPVTHAENIRAPLFVIQGASDPRVPRDESDQIVERLRGRGVDVRYDVYPDEGHTFVKSANRVKSFSDAAQFLIDHLRE